MNPADRPLSNQSLGESESSHFKAKNRFQELRDGSAQQKALLASLKTYLDAIKRRAQIEDVHGYQIRAVKVGAVAVAGVGSAIGLGVGLSELDRDREAPHAATLFEQSAAGRSQGWNQLQQSGVFEPGGADSSQLDPQAAELAVNGFHQMLNSTNDFFRGAGAWFAEKVVLPTAEVVPTATATAAVVAAGAGVVATVKLAGPTARARRELRNAEKEVELAKAAVYSDVHDLAISTSQAHPNMSTANARVAAQTDAWLQLAQTEAPALQLIAGNQAISRDNGIGLSIR